MLKLSNTNTLVDYISTIISFVRVKSATFRKDKFNHHLSLLFLLLLSINNTFGEHEELDGYFLFPINSGNPSSLAGTFGELRGNHFHSGIDIRTNGEVDIPVSSAAEGYISRINVSEVGFGKAIYIQHPNGYTTVYAHLNKFSDKIERYVRNAQYSQKSFTLKLFPKINEIPVNIGELIAYSGNTGGSQAPHLHFEIRNIKSEPINPLFANFKELRDTIAPRITALTFTPFSKGDIVSTSTTTGFLTFPDSLSTYILKESIPALGTIGLGIEVYDNNNGANNLNGVNRIIMYVDGEKTFEYKINKFSFSQSKFVKTHLTYDTYKLAHIAAHRCYKQESNVLPFYSTINDGRIIIAAGDKKHVRIEAYDFNNNKSSIEFTLVGSNETSKRIVSLPSPSSHATYIEKGISKTFKTESCHIYFSTKSLFESMYLELIQVSDTFDLQMNTAPLKGKITIGLKPNIPQQLRAKTKVYSYNKRKDSFYNEGGTWNGDFIEFKTKSFDQYLCLTDTVKPVFLNPIEKENSFKINIQDNLSGISKYKAQLDGVWVLLEYYPNDNSFQVLTLNNTHLKGELIIDAWDDVDNRSTYKYNFK